MTSTKIINQKQYQALQNDISELLIKAKQEIQDTANKILVESYWRIGERINQESLTKNANYKNLLLEDLERDLRLNKKTLTRALNLYQSYPSGIKENLSWSHYLQLTSVKDQKTRNSLTKKAQSQNWSVRQLESNIKELNNPAKSKSSSAIQRPTDPSYLYKAKIIDVVDGDTLILNIDLGFQVIKEQRIRLMQINAPEMKTKAGQESHRYLRDLCASIEKVAVKTNKVDIYGRFLADIFYLEGELKQGTTQADIFEKGVYLNQKIVEDGFAEKI